jgi:TolB-like protein/tetratricopeptide (TPR) repeat protein
MDVLSRLGRLLAELRRRRVYQVAALYAVAAWVVVEVSETTFPYLGLSERAIRGLIIAAVCGFPVAVSLGWLFDLTPEGVVRTPGAPHSTTRRTRRRRRGPDAARVAMVGAALVLAVTVGGWWVSRVPLEAAESNSVAVLPFVNMSEDSADDYFADGMMDELIAQLSKASGLRVISRTSAMRYRGTERTAPEIARELGVGAVIEGSVRRTGGEVRITVQLIDGATDTPVWSEQYDRRLEDVLAVQSEVAGHVAQALRVRLSAEERRRIDAVPTKSAEAYEAYLRGRYFWNRRTPEGLTRAVAEFQSALEADPGYSLAWAGLADTYAGLSQYALHAPGEVMPRAREAALRALSLDGTLAEGHASLGMIRFWYDWDWAAADAAYLRSLELNPSYATAAHWRALLLASLGREEEAWDAIRLASSLDPISPLIRTGRGMIRFYARDFAAARDEVLAALELDPTYPEALVQLGQVLTALGEYGKAISTLEALAAASQRNPRVLGPLGYVYALSGRPDDAAAVAAELEALAASAFVPATTIALIHGGLGDMDIMFQWLDRAFEERDPLLTSLAVHPASDMARDDPRFHPLLAALGLGPRSPSAGMGRGDAGTGGRSFHAGTVGAMAALGR